jgi:hypothetical protein
MDVAMSTLGPGTKHARNMAGRPWSEARSAGPGQYAVDLQG